MASHYVQQIRGGTSNSSLAARSMVVNGANNSISSAGTDSLIAGNNNSVTASKSIVLGSYGTADDVSAIVISAPDSSTTAFTSRGSYALSSRLHGALDMTGLTAPSSAGLVAGSRASAVVSIVAASVSAGETVTINGTIVFTATNGARTPGSNDFDMSSGVDATVAADLVAAINDGANSAAAAYVAVDNLDGSLVIYYRTPGVAGNSLTLATTSAGITVPALFSGGTNGYTFKSMYVQGNEDAAASDTNYFALVEYDRWLNEDTSVDTNEQKVLTANYIPQKAANWTGLSVIDSSLSVAPNNVAAALDILAKGLLGSQPSENLFITAAGSGDASGLLAYNTGALNVDGTEDFLLGVQDWNTANTPFLGVATSKYSLVVGQAASTQLDYSNIGTGVLNVGLNNVSSGDYSQALGSGNSVASDYSLAVGQSNSISAASSNSMVLGQALTVSGTSTGAIMLGGASGVAHTISGSNGAFLQVDNLSTRTAAAVTSQDFVHKTQYFNGFIRGSGLASVDATDASAALTDTATDEGAREIFRPLHIEALTASSTTTLGSVFSVAANHYVAIRGYVSIASSTEKVLFKIDDFLCDTTSVLNEPTIAKLYDVTQSWSPFDLTLAVASNKVTVAVANPTADTPNVNIVLYIHDVFA